MARPERSAMDESSVRCNVRFRGGGEGEKFIRQINLDFTCNFDFGLKKYVVNMDDYGNLRNIVLQKYPSLARYGDFRMVMTTHQVK